MSRYLSLLLSAGLIAIAADARAQSRPAPAAPAATPPSAVPIMPIPTPAQTTPPRTTDVPIAIPTQAPPQRPGTTPQPAMPTPVMPGATRDSVPMQNVRVDLQITDAASGTGTPAKKVVTMLMADGRNGRIRSANQITNVIILINVDATASVRPDGRILLSLTVEYAPEQGTNKAATISESMTVLVNDGKLTLVSQSADPATDRQVKVEVTATVIK